MAHNVGLSVVFPTGNSENEKGLLENARTFSEGHLVFRFLQRVRTSVSRILSNYRVADSSALAAALASIHGTGAVFDAAVLDVRMPGMDGKSVVSHIRSVEAAAGHPPLLIAAMTANAFTEDRAACLAAGFDVFLPKPMDRGAIGAFVQDAARYRQRTAKAA